MQLFARGWLYRKRRCIIANMLVQSAKLRAPVLLWATLGLFLAAIVYILASSVSRRSVAAFTVTAPSRVRVASQEVDTITVDASDPKEWRFVDLQRPFNALPLDTSGWDLAVRRYHIFSAGGVASLGSISFESVARAPRAGYLATEFGRDTVNAAIARWYRYSMLTHLLEPTPGVYVAQSTDVPPRYAKFQLLSYYCPGPRPGCLTLRYAAVEPP